MVSDYFGQLCWIGYHQNIFWWCKKNDSSSNLLNFNQSNFLNVKIQLHMEEISLVLTHSVHWKWIIDWNLVQ